MERCDSFRFHKININDDGTVATAFDINLSKTQTHLLSFLKVFFSDIVLMVLFNMQAPKNRDRN